MLMLTVPLSGKKMTSKRLAVKPEFSWQAASEFECSSLSRAKEGATSVASDARTASGRADQSFMLSAVL